MGSKKLTGFVLIVLISFFSSIVQSVETTSPCGTAVSECTLEDWLASPSSITMCFQKLEVSCDNGLAWTKIFDAKKIGGIEINLVDLDKNVDLSNIKGLRFGTLRKNTFYTCAKGVVSSVIITPTNGIPCRANTIIEEEGIKLSSMYIRGNDECPGNIFYPTFAPFKTDDSSSVDLRFNGEMSFEGFPKFTLKPINIDEMQDVNMGESELFSTVEFETEEIN